MGSKEIFNLAYREAFAFIGVMGRLANPNEKRGFSELHIS